MSLRRVTVLAPAASARSRPRRHRTWRITPSRLRRHLASLHIRSGSSLGPYHLTSAFDGRYHPLALFPGGWSARWTWRGKRSLSRGWNPRRRRCCELRLGVGNAPITLSGWTPGRHFLLARFPSRAPSTRPLKILALCCRGTIMGLLRPYSPPRLSLLFGTPYTNDVCLYTRPHSAFSSC